MIEITDKSYDRLIRIYKNVCGRDPVEHYGIADPNIIVDLMIKEIGDLLGIK